MSETSVKGMVEDRPQGIRAGIREDIRDLDRRIKTLSAETRGLRGEVLRRARPEEFEAKRAELRAATAEYFRYYFDTSSVSMP